MLVLCIGAAGESSAQGRASETTVESDANRSSGECFGAAAITRDFRCRANSAQRKPLAVARWGTLDIDIEQHQQAV